MPLNLTRAFANWSGSRPIHVLSVAITILCTSAFAGAQTVTKVALSPATVAGGNSSTGTVTISKKAGSSGVVVELASSSPAAAVASTVTVASGKTTATFKITTTPVSSNTSATITAALGESSESASILVKAPTLTLFTIDPATVTGGNNSTGTVTISSAAPSNGMALTVTSNSSLAKVPTQIVVPSGATSTTFSIATTAVKTPNSAKIKVATSNTSLSLTLTINPAGLDSLGLNPKSVVGGVNSTATVTLSGPAPTGGISLALSSGNKAVTVPASLEIPAGSSSGTFTVTTATTTEQLTSKISAKLGSGSVSATLTVTPTPKSPYAGDFKGSFYSTSGSIGPCEFIIDSSGNVTATATDVSSGTAQTVALTGVVTSTGAVTVTSNGTQPKTNTGTASFNTAGDLVLTLTNQTTNPPTITVTANTDTRPFEYAGVYSGSLLATDGSSGSVTMTIGSGGGLSGSGSIGTSKFTLSGSVSKKGVANTDQFYVAFNASGQLVMFVINSDGTTTTGILTAKSSGANP